MISYETFYLFVDLSLLLLSTFYCDDKMLEHLPSIAEMDTLKE